VNSFVCIVLATLCLGPQAAAQTKSKPARRGGPSPVPLVLAPKLAPGQSLRYQLDFRSHAKGNSTSAIANPQGARAMHLSVSVLTRVDVLPAPPPAKSASSTAALRLRSTYEKIAAMVRSDVPDTESEEMERQFAKLEGKSFEFTMDPDGRVRDVAGLEGLSPEQAKAAREWLTEFAGGEAAPPGGIVPGQKWTTEQDAGAALPLAGVKWVRESTYLRDEPCRASRQGPAGRENCAVILTRSLLARQGDPKDATPAEYKAQGLTTTGAIEGTAESLTYISLTTGLVVSVTQSGTEQMDVTITSADGSSTIHYTADVKTDSQLSLLSSHPPPKP
jgi:hypothetical protein